MDALNNAFDQMVERYPDDEPGRMLRSPGLKTGGRFYAFTSRGVLTVKLPATRVTDLIGTGEGTPCDPRGGHPMREWVQLTPADEPTCLAYLIEARTFTSKK